jgi:hypothetical protein
MAHPAHATLSSTMASVETPPRPTRTERASRPRRRTSKSPARRDRSAVDQGARAATRTPSQRALEAKASFDLLSHYFGDRSQLAKVLGWTPPTMRTWLREAPLRPRVEHIDRVRRTLEVARAAEEWAHDDVHQVGEWFLASNDAMGGLSPAAVIRKLGDEGVGRLLDGMYRIAPRTSAYEHVDLSAERLREALDRVGLPAPRPSAPVDVDLSDFA